VLAATMFQSTAAGMISIVEDRKTDYSRALFVAPVTRPTLITGKIAGETLVAFVQGACVVAFAVMANQRSAMEIFQFLIIPQYLLGGVIVPLAGVTPYLAAIADAMPLRYAVDLTRAAFYRGTPGYGRVVTGGPALDLAVISALFVTLMTAGTILFGHRERAR
jgi:ABC-2 type transport system permease protein